MRSESDNLRSIVLVELGAGWPGWLVDYQRKAPNSIVVAQAVGDTPGDFAARALQRIAEAKAAHDRPVRVGVMVCNGEPERELRAFRKTIASALLGALSREGAELVLALNEGCDKEKHDLFALAGDLCEMAKDPRVNVRVRFFSENAGSGIMRAASPVKEAAAVAALRR